MKRKMDKYPVRLGGPILQEFSSAEEWIKIHKKLGYSAAYFPLSENETDEKINEYAQAASDADIIIAEVGIWNNPLSPFDDEREKAFRESVKKLELAEKCGAKCCVNISGSRSREHWFGPHPDNLTEETFDMIVETTQKIIDEVKPETTFYTLEPMPWLYPDSIETYQKLISAIDRKQFGVHFDPVNLISSPQLYYNNTQFIKDFFETFGNQIKSIHAKDILLSGNLTTHLSEVLPGRGYLDLLTLLKYTSSIKDLPFMLEHWETEEEYKISADNVRSLGKKNDIQFK